MTWYVLRHAEKERGNFHNPQLRHQDEPLSEKGRQEAEKLVAFFAGKPLSAIYVSAYQRTAQTADAIARQLHLTSVVDARLNEIDNGDIDQMTEAEFAQAYPDVWQAYRARTADFRFPGGESGTEVMERVRSFFEQKRSQHGDDDILLVTHDGLIRQMMCYMLGLPVYRRGDFRTSFCGLTELSYQEDVGRWKLIRFNCNVQE